MAPWKPCTELYTGEKMACQAQTSQAKTCKTAPFESFLKSELTGLGWVL